MNPLKWLKAWELKRLLALAQSITASGGTIPVWLSNNIAELESES